MTATAGGSVKIQEKSVSVTNKTKTEGILFGDRGKKCLKSASAEEVDYRKSQYQYCLVILTSYDRCEMVYDTSTHKRKLTDSNGRENGLSVICYLKSGIRNGILHVIYTDLIADRELEFFIFNSSNLKHQNYLP